jgi:hypothetical protein
MCLATIPTSWNASGRVVGLDAVRKYGTNNSRTRQDLGAATVPRQPSSPITQLYLQLYSHTDILPHSQAIAKASADVLSWEYVLQKLCDEIESLLSFIGVSCSSQIIHFATRGETMRSKLLSYLNLHQMMDGEFRRCSLASGSFIRTA